MNAARALRTAVLRGPPPPPPPLPRLRRTIPPAALVVAQTHPRFYSRKARPSTPPKTAEDTPEDPEVDEADSDEASGGTDDQIFAGTPGMTAEKAFRRALRQGPEKPYYYGNASHFLKRIGKCLTFGCDPEQTAEAARLARLVAEDWAGIQLGQGNAVVDPAAVHRARINRAFKDASWEPESDSWGAIPRPFPVPVIAEEAVLKFLGHQVTMAEPKIKAKWKQIRVRQRRMHNLDKHAQIRAVLIPPLSIRRIIWSIILPEKYTRAVQNVSVYTRLQNFDQIKDRIRFTLRATIWSHRENMMIAEAQIIMMYNPWLRERGLKWFTKEMERLLRHESPDKVALYRDMTKSLRQLEHQTWRRKDAVEDLGSAAPASADQ